MKLAALLASAFVATTVQASEVTVKYCLEGGPCTDASVKPFACNRLPYPSYLSSVQNTAACVLFENPVCGGRPDKYLPRGSHAAGELQGIYVESFECAEPGLQRNRAPAVQAAEVTVNYCLDDGECTDATLEPYKCYIPDQSGLLTSIQNTADCKVFRYPGCKGPSRFVARGSHDSGDLHDTILGSLECSEPGLQRNLAPAVQDPEVTLYYCFDTGRCVDQEVEPNECTELEESGYLTSIQNTADCELFTFPTCGGRSVFVRRGSTQLQGTFARAIKCSKPGFQRNQRPMRML